jgi:hypothetical protein
MRSKVRCKPAGTTCNALWNCRSRCCGCARRGPGPNACVLRGAGKTKVKRSTFCSTVSTHVRWIVGSRECSCTPLGPGPARERGEEHRPHVVCVLEAEAGLFSCNHVVSKCGAPCGLPHGSCMAGTLPIHACALTSAVPCSASAAATALLDMCMML